MLLYITLIACAAVFGAQVYRYDLKDREPIGALLLAAFLGAAGMWLAGLVQVAVMRNLGSLAADHWNACMSVTAGVTEEAAKLTAVVLVIGLRPRWFNDPMDGLVYGGFAGLGAALLESVMLLAGREPMFLPATEPVRLAGHLTMGGIAAFGIAYMKLGRRGWKSRLALGFMAAVALHITWDLIAFDAADRGRLSLPHTIGSMIVMLGGMVMFRGMFRVAAGETRGLGGRGARGKPGVAGGPAVPPRERRRDFRLDLEPGRPDRRRPREAGAGLGAGAGI